MKKYIPIEHPDWLYKMNFKCLKRPEMDVSIGRARILGECVRTLKSSKSLFHSSATLFFISIKQDCYFFLKRDEHTSKRMMRGMMSSIVQIPLIWSNWS